MMKKMLLATVMFAAYPVQAQEGFVGFFNEVCVQAVPDIDDVAEIAQDRQWSTMAPEALTAIAPSADRLEGWRAATDGTDYLVSISEVSRQGTKITTCSVVASNVDGDSLAERLSKMFNSPYAAERRASDYRTVGWPIRLNGQKMIISLTTPYRNGTANLSAVVVE